MRKGRQELHRSWLAEKGLHEKRVTADWLELYLDQQLTEIHDLVPLDQHSGPQKKAKRVAPLTVAAGGTGRIGIVNTVPGHHNCIKRELEMLWPNHSLEDVFTLPLAYQNIECPLQNDQWNHKKIQDVENLERKHASKFQETTDFLKIFLKMFENISNFFWKGILMIIFLKCSSH